MHSTFPGPRSHEGMAGNTDSPGFRSHGSNASGIETNWGSRALGKSVELNFIDTDGRDRSPPSGGVAQMCV